MYDREGVISSKRSPHGMHKHARKQVHEHLQSHAEDTQRLTVESLHSDLLRWHYHFDHLYFKLIKAMVEVGLLPKNLDKSPIPKCSGCMFSTRTKNIWHSKGINTSGQVG